MAQGVRTATALMAVVLMPPRLTWACPVCLAVRGESPALHRER